MAVVIDGHDDKFRIPRNMNDQEVLETARAFLRDAEPYKSEFLRREVREAVFQSLEANIVAFEAALSGKYTGNEESAAAVAAIDAGIQQSQDALRQLDPIVRNKLQHDMATLAAWNAATHIERAPRRAKPDVPATPNH
jgi:hypothetical protein